MNLDSPFHHKMQSSYCGNHRSQQRYTLLLELPPQQIHISLLAHSLSYIDIQPHMSTYGYIFQYCLRMHHISIDILQRTQIPFCILSKWLMHNHFLDNVQHQPPIQKFEHNLPLECIVKLVQRQIPLISSYAFRSALSHNLDGLFQITSFLLQFHCIHY